MSFQGDLSSWKLENVEDVSKMFAGAFLMNADLCDWSESLPATGVNTQNMFLASGCPSQVDPIDTSSGPFCHPCASNSSVIPTSISTFHPTAAPATGSIPPLRAFQSVDELYDAIDSYLEIGSSAEKMYGPISWWDVSHVTNMSRIFSVERNRAVTLFNADLSGWDTSNAVTMEMAFQGAESFDGDLSSWNVGKVTSMSKMFQNAHKFRGIGLSSWNTSKVQNFNSTFEGADLFDGNLSEWNTQSASFFEATFREALSFHTGVAKWNMSRALIIKDMFSNAISFNDDLSTWETSSITSMMGTFQYADRFLGFGITTWDVSKVHDFRYMFRYAFPSH
jgi:surface protein